MKILLIDANGMAFQSSSIRKLSSVLKEKGHSTKMAFLNITQLHRRPYLLSAKSIKSTLGVIKKEQPDLIGISIMSPYLERAAQINNAIKSNFSVPVVWGGRHVQIAPENSISHSSIICLGEGEEAIVDLADRIQKRQGYYDLPGFWFRDKNTVIKNKFRPPPEDINNFPFPDYNVPDQYMLKNEELVKMDERDFWRCVGLDCLGTPRFYIIHAVRGCPYSCTFCHNTIVRDRYGFTKVRFRSLDSIVKEIKYVKEKLPFFQSIRFSEDDFLIRSLDEIKRFARVYKTECGMPFSCFCHPITLTEEKIEILKEAGLKRTCIGIETGSTRINKEVYDRDTSYEMILDKIDILNGFQRRGITVEHEFIIDNPIETNADIGQTISMILRISKRSILSFYSLRFYPDSILHMRAKKQGCFSEDRNRGQFFPQPAVDFGKYHITDHNYLTYVLLLKGVIFRGLPNFIVNMLSGPRMAKFGDSISLSRLNWILGRQIFYYLYLFIRILRKI